MKEIKGKIDYILQYIEEQSSINKYFTPQIEIGGREKDKHMNAPFLAYLDTLSEKTIIDVLPGKSGLRRETTDLELKDVIQNAITADICGIKVVKNPLSSFSEWDKWEDGYIEGFCRMDADEKGKDWFVWMYIKMKHLRDILEIYEDYLYLL